MARKPWHEQQLRQRLHPWGTYLTCRENSSTSLAAPPVTMPSAAPLKSLPSSAMVCRKTARALPVGHGGRRAVRALEQQSERRHGGRRPPQQLQHLWLGGEIDPFRPDSKPVKRTALGRFNHEGAWPAPAKAGEPIVIYSGDDARNEYVYKFVSDAKWDPKDINGGTAAGASTWTKARSTSPSSTLTARANGWS